ncbi:MAG TPA: cytochrome c maturation protein CcmE [Solirubrobacteraceae bacterium]|nr:cytochrome c maturation protein CcmE [Solirubrobacteraceae bacterium]
MDPSRKRAIRLTVALTAAVLLAAALVYVSFTAGNKEYTASQLLTLGKPGQTYELAGTVLDGSVKREGATLLFSIRDPKKDVAVPVRYTGVVPDPFAPGRAVMVAVREDGTQYIGQSNSLTTKCPSKYQAAAAS